MKKKIITPEELVGVIIIMAILVAIAIPRMTKKEPKVIWISTSSDTKAMFYDLNTLKQVEGVEQSYNETLRLEFNGIKDGWIELSGPYPREYEARLAKAKEFAIKKGILTEEELEIFGISVKQTKGNKTTVKLSRTD